MTTENIEIIDSDDVTVEFALWIEDDTLDGCFDSKVLPFDASGKEAMTSEQEFFQKAQHLSVGIDKTVVFAKYTTRLKRQDGLSVIITRNRITSPLKVSRRELAKVTRKFHKGEVVSQEIEYPSDEE